MVAQTQAVEPEALPEAVTDAEPVRVNPFSRLRAVHDEALETSRLANLLGRSFYVSLLLPALAIAAVIIAGAPIVRALSFAALVFMGAGALLYVYVRTIRTPFLHLSLREFAADLDAIMLYAGFAWGAGAFLILPAASGPAVAVLFSGCAAALVAAFLGSREPVFMFAAPAGLLTALAAFLQPLTLPPVTATLSVLTCGLVAGAVALSSWMKERAFAAPAVVERA
jgi:hypothetical protein